MLSPFFCVRTLAVACLALLFAASSGAAADRPNVLFIAIDDLRPQLGCYGKSFMHSPNIDALAKRGVLFEQAYCMVPTCGASRASLMTGIRPAPHRFVNYLAWAEKDAPGVTTLNTHFREQGYHTVSLGKVFHHKTDSLAGWSEEPWRPSGSDYQRTELQAEAMRKHRKQYPQRKKVRGMAYESAEAPDGDYRDGQNANRAIEVLRERAAEPDRPFFLAVGFYKPHLPFTAPKKYWDLYDAEQIEIPANYRKPDDVPEGAWHNSGELRAYAGIPPQGIVDRDTAKKLIHGYYACVSFTDAQVGRVMEELDRLELSENTIVVLWGDHGWNLGEHAMWNKHSCFETSMHAPLLIMAPQASGVKAGARVASMTEFIDIYPTLCQLAGLPAPEHLQGASLVPQLRDPQAPGKSFAIGRFRTGDTIRTAQYRLSEYGQDPEAAMLYDHTTDPAENENLADEPAVSDEQTELSATLHRHQGKDQRKQAE